MHVPPHSLLLVGSLIVGCDHSPDADGGVDAATTIQCPPPTRGPTMHGGDVEPNEIWTADASPHIVTYDVAVRDGHALTIEPCAWVQLAAGKGISVASPITPNTGTLIAMGTAQQPIRFERLDAEPWANIYVRAPGTARLAYVELAGGGADEGATLETVGDGVLPADPTLLLDHLVISDSGGPGLRVRGGATFLPGGDALTITGAGSFPAEIDEHSMDAFPTGHYTGNAIDEVLLDSTGVGIAGVGLTVDATLHDRGVPYRLAGSFYLGGLENAPLATMTIEPGVVMRFPKDASLLVETFTGDHPAQAALHAVGTAARPIVFTSAEPAPAPGDWLGVWFGASPSANNQIAFARIEYAGGECRCSLATCSQSTESEGAVIFTRRPPSAFITSSVIAHSGQHGITQGFVGEPLDFKSSNTFEDIAGCAQTSPVLPLGCPDPRPTCE